MGRYRRICEYAICGLCARFQSIYNKLNETEPIFFLYGTAGTLNIDSIFQRIFISSLSRIVIHLFLLFLSSAIKVNSEHRPVNEIAF